jgi:RNA polymerase sigma factor (sigma-70 family)
VINHHILAAIAGSAAQRGGSREPFSPPARTLSTRSDLGALVRAAAAGSEPAWSDLVGRFDRLLRAIARSYRLSPADVDDVVQETWIRLFKCIGRLRDPAAIRPWLMTCTRRESLRRLQCRVPEQLTDDPALGDGVAPDCPERAALAAERRATVARSLAALPERHAQLMTLLASEPAPDYREVSRALGMPHGSIGPIRARCLARLERNPELIALRGCI